MYTNMSNYKYTNLCIQICIISKRVRMKVKRRNMGNNYV